MKRLTDSLPDWMRSVRFRLTLYYSLALFALAAVLVGTLYFALQSSLQGPVAPPRRVVLLDPQEGPRPAVEIPAAQFERSVNERTLKQLKKFSFGALGALFVVSLAVGWALSGRVLAPIGRITDVAKRIQATDLSRRIDLQGPHDELKRLADTFDSMLARLDEAFAVQRQFIADASHELRNPIAVIRTNVDVALHNKNMTEEEMRDTAVIVKRVTARMGRLVDDLLALARLDSPSEHYEDVDLAVIARETDAELSALAAEKDVEVVADVEGPLGAVGDRDALKRALANLVDNAIRFAPPGSTVSIEGGRQDGWAWVSVTDAGPGIAPEVQDKVFDRFWRADKARSREHGGSGLGLAIVKQVAEAHGGEVLLDSSPGEGSKFSIRLPSASEGGASATERATAATQASPV